MQKKYIKSSCSINNGMQVHNLYSWQKAKKLFLNLFFNVTGKLSKTSASIKNKVVFNQQSKLHRFALSNGVKVILTSLIATFACTGVIYATTIVGTNISTTGTLSVTASTTLNGVEYGWPSSDGSANQVLTTNSSGVLSWAAVATGSGTINYGAAGTIPFYSSAGTTATGTTNSLLFWDDTNARLGIGTTSPYAKLSVWGDGVSGIIAFNVMDSASTTLFTILDSGFIGIGTTSPYAALSVVGEIVGSYFTSTSTTATSTFYGNVDVQGDLTATYQGVTKVCSVAIGSVSDISVNGNIGYVTINQMYTGSPNNIKVGQIAIVNLDTCAIIGYFAHENMVNPHSSVYSEGFIYVNNASGSSNKKGGITVLDVRDNPNAPKYAGYFSPPASVTFYGGKNIRVSGKYVVISGGRSGTNSGGIWFFDKTNPYDLKYINEIEHTTDGVCTERIGSPTTPDGCLFGVQGFWCDETGYCIIPHSGEDNLVSVNLNAYTGTSQGKIIDILEDATNFQGNFAADYYNSCNNSTCFFGTSLTGGSPRIVSIDITDKYNLRLLDTDTTDTGLSNALYLSGDTLYGANENTGTLWVYDVSNPSAINNLESIAIAESPDDQLHMVTGSGNKLFILGYDANGINVGSLYIYQINGIKAESADINALAVGNLDVTGKFRGESISLNGSVSAGGVGTFSQGLTSNGFSVSNQYTFDTPSISTSTGEILINNFYTFNDSLYATMYSGTDAKVLLYGQTAGSAWSSPIDVSAVLGGDNREIANAICEFNDSLYVGVGGAATEAGLIRCTKATCDSVDDFTSAFYTAGGNETEVASCIGYNESLFIGTKGATGLGDIYFCDYNSSSCDEASDWGILMDSSSASGVNSMVVHGKYLYASFISDTDSTIRYCDTLVDGRCDEAAEWKEALNYGGSYSYTTINRMFSYGGCLYASISDTTFKGDILRCCTADSVCNQDSDWEVFMDEDTNRGTYGFMPIKGGFVFGQENNSPAVSDVYFIPGNNDLGLTYNKVKLLDYGDGAGRYANAFTMYHDNLFFGYQDAVNGANIYTLPMNNGYVTRYKNDVTAGNGLSSIVGYVSQTAQTAAISETNIIIPPADGLYRVSITQQITTAGSTGYITTTINYTDATSNVRSVATGLLNCNAVGTNTITQIIQAQASDAISYNVTEGSSCDGTWSTYITVERLN